MGYKWIYNKTDPYLTTPRQVDASGIYSVLFYSCRLQEYPKSPVRLVIRQAQKPQRILLYVPGVFVETGFYALKT